MRTILKGISTGGMALVFALGASAALADDDEILPAEQVISAIKTAVAEHPGKVKEVEVDRKRGDKMVVEVTVVDAEGKKTEIHVDPVSNEVIR